MQAILKQGKTVVKKDYLQADTVLADVHRIKIDGKNISLNHSVVTIYQPDHVKALQKTDKNSFGQSSQIMQRAREAYIASIRHLDLTFGIVARSQVFTAKSESAKRVSIFLDTVKQNYRLGLTFVSLNVESIFIAIFASTSFMIETDLTAQLGLIV